MGVFVLEPDLIRVLPAITISCSGCGGDGYLPTRDPHELERCLSCVGSGTERIEPDTDAYLVLFCELMALDTGKGYHVLQVWRALRQTRGDYSAARQILEPPKPPPPPPITQGPLPF